MKGPRPDTLFRVGGLVACAAVALPQLAANFSRDVAAFLNEAGIRDLSGIHLEGTRVALAVVPIAVAALFAAAFWVNTRPAVVERRRPGAVALLAVQTLIALAVNDYLFIVAAQAPLVFQPSGALAWLGGQSALLCGSTAILFAMGLDVPTPEVPGAPPGLAVPVTLAYLAGWQIFAFGVGYLAAHERRSRRELERRAREMAATHQMLADSTRVAERAEISRELHDTLGHSLSVLSVNLELASHLSDGRAADAVAKAQTVARMLLADVREVVHSLGDRDDVDLQGALRTLVDGAHSPAIHLDLPESLDLPDPSRTLAVFRCIQEAITNAARHARARNLWIVLRTVSDGLTVQVRDDGVGATSVVPGYGLKVMRERLEVVGGRLAVTTAPGSGVTIDAWVPVSKGQS